MTTLPELSKHSITVLRQYPAVIDFASVFNYDYCNKRYIHIKTNVDGLTSGTVRLRELSECYGDENITNWIAAWLISISSYMNFEISEQQAKTTSLFILEELYMVNIAEFTLFFKQLIKGSRGIFYGKFNGQTILTAAIEFRKARGIVLSSMSSEEQEFLK